MISRRSRYLLFVVLILSACNAGVSSYYKQPARGMEYSGDNEIQYLPEEIPAIVISYGLFCARYDEFRCLEANPRNALMKFGKSVDMLPGGISTGLGFAHRAFIVQNNIENHQSGYTHVRTESFDKSSVPFESILFVTTPIESYHNRVIVILSSVSPEQTTIFSVDNRFITELLYDSFKNNNVGGETFVLGSIYSVQVLKPGLLLLHERIPTWARANTCVERTINLELREDTFKLSEKTP